MLYTTKSGKICLDFTKCEEKAKLMTPYALWYSARDAKEAAQAYPDNPKSGAYIDEALVYLQELRRRSGSV